MTNVPTVIIHPPYSDFTLEWDMVTDCTEILLLYMVIFSQRNAYTTIKKLKTKHHTCTTIKKTVQVNFVPNIPATFRHQIKAAFVVVWSVLPMVLFHLLYPIHIDDIIK